MIWGGGGEGFREIDPRKGGMRNEGEATRESQCHLRTTTVVSPSQLSPIRRRHELTNQPPLFLGRSPQGLLYPTLPQQTPAYPSLKQQKKLPFFFAAATCGRRVPCRQGHHRGRDGQAGHRRPRRRPRGLRRSLACLCWRGEL